MRVQQCYEALHRHYRSVKPADDDQPESDEEGDMLASAVAQLG